MNRTVKSIDAILDYTNGRREVAETVYQGKERKLAVSLLCDVIRFCEEQKRLEEKDG